MIHLNLTPGDIIARKKGPVWHFGVWLSSGIVHNTPEKGEHISSLPGFSNGQAIEIIKPLDINREEIVHRAYEIVSRPAAYQYLWRNCEHTVNEITCSEATSPTVNNVAKMVLMIGGALIVIKYRSQLMQVLKQCV